MNPLLQSHLFARAAWSDDATYQKAHQAPDQAALRSPELSKLWWERLESLSPRSHQALAKELGAAGLTVEDYFKTLASLNAPAISTFLFELASKRDS